jgi:hypothetical protein
MLELETKHVSNKMNSSPLKLHVISTLPDGACGWALSLRSLTPQHDLEQFSLAELCDPFACGVQLHQCICYYSLLCK